MSTASSTSSSTMGSGIPTTADPPPTSPEEGKPVISAAERWLRIREAACLHAQKRGFVGGDPLKEWLDAEKEIDAKYTTDFRGVCSRADPAEITTQIKHILAAYGLTDLSVEALLENYQKRMQRFVNVDRALVKSTTELASQQTALAQEALQEAVSVLRSVAQGKLSPEALTKQAALSMKAMENALSHLRVVTEAVTGMARGSDKESPSKS
jgi:hypothetical protein